MNYPVLNVVDNFILDVIRRYPTVNHSKHDVLVNIMLGNGTGYSWNKDGQIVCPLDRKKRKFDITSDVAYSKFLDVKFVQLPYYVAWAPLFNIPHNIHPDWEHEIKYFICDLLRMSRKEYKIHLGSYLLLHYRHNPEHLKKEMLNRMKYRDEVIKHVTKLAKEMGL